MGPLLPGRWGADQTRLPEEVLPLDRAAAVSWVIWGRNVSKSSRSSYNEKIIRGNTKLGKFSIDNDNDSP
jgi:hypothetical protein